MTLAEVSIALAGFGGIVAGLGYRSKGNWSSRDKFRLLVMVAASIAVVFACFLPLTFQSLAFDDHWRVASGFLVLIPLANLIAQYFWIREGIAQANIPAVLVILLSNLIALWLALSLLLNMHHPNLSAGLYLAATVSTLATPAMLFIRLVITSFTQDND